MVKTSMSVLGKLLMRAAADIDKAGARQDADRMEALNTAKVKYYVGYNNMTLADCSTDEEEQLTFYAAALNAFCDGQCYARLAMDSPYTIE